MQLLQTVVDADLLRIDPGEVYILYTLLTFCSIWMSTGKRDPHLLPGLSVLSIKFICQKLFGCRTWSGFHSFFAKFTELLLYLLQRKTTGLRQELGCKGDRCDAQYHENIESRG